MCRYTFVAMYRFVRPFREAKFCCVLSSVFDKLRCAGGDKWSRYTDLCYVSVTKYKIKYFS
jgi:hypothetical protein